MALAVVQRKNGSTSANQTTSTVTVTALTAGSLVVVACGCQGTHTISTVTDNKAGGSNTYTRAANAAASTGDPAKTDIFYCLSAGAGATTITITFSGAAAELKAANVWEISGFTNCQLDSANHVNSQTTSGGTDSGPSITTTSTTGFLAAVIYENNGNSANPKAGNEYTTSGVVVASFFPCCSKISSTAAAHQPQWTPGSSGSYCVSHATFKEAAVATNSGFFWLASGR